MPTAKLLQESLEAHSRRQEQQGSSPAHARKRLRTESSLAEITVVFVQCVDCSVQISAQISVQISAQTSAD